MFYHGVSGTCNGFVYSMGAAILDKDNPSKVLYRTRDYLLTPEKEYEKTVRRLFLTIPYLSFQLQLLLK